MSKYVNNLQAIKSGIGHYQLSVAIANKFETIKMKHCAEAAERFNIPGLAGPD